MTKTFQELGIDVDATKALKEIGYEVPFPIQQEAIPLMLKGVDVIGQAHTGTGKTAAFALPILTKIKRRGSIQALILVPTRELAVQVTGEINKFAKYTGIRTVCIYGGQRIGIQYDKLRRGVQVIVATPGRLIDHIKQGSIHLDKVNTLVLDEADRMLDMGFIDDIKYILRHVKEDRQTCLFSATMSQEVLTLAQEYMNSPRQIRLNEQESSLDTIDQSYLVIYEKEKFKHLCDFLKSTDNKQTIVFASTKQRTHRLASELKQEGFRATTIHGDLSQNERDRSIYKFKKGFEDILVATDIASRGIDVPAVGHIINYDVPADPTIYFNRIGRTARAGATGKAISLVSQDRIEDFGRILRRTEKPIRKLNEEMGIKVPSTHLYPNREYRSKQGVSNGYNRGYTGRTYARSFAHSRYGRPRNQKL